MGAEIDLYQNELQPIIALGMLYNHIVDGKKTSKHVFLYTNLNLIMFRFSYFLCQILWVRSKIINLFTYDLNLRSNHGEL